MDSTTSAILSISKALSCCLHSLQMETWVESEVGIFFSKAVPCQDKCDKTKRHMTLQIRLLQIIRVSEISDLLQWVVCDNEIKIISSTLLLNEGIPRALKGKKPRLKNILLLPLIFEEINYF